MNYQLSSTYRPDIDALRAIAVLSVLLYHSFPEWLPGGFAGVDVFFVISGFLITGIIWREFLEGNFSLSNFYARRVRRIFPALIAILITCLVFGWFVLFETEYKQLIDEVEERKSELKAVYLQQMKALEALILPLLYNLMKNPTKEYIHWPNRTETINQQISKIISVTRTEMDI